MKSTADIEHRLEKLRVRYLRQWIDKVRGRRFTNCIYNHEFYQSPIPNPRQERQELLVPRRQVTMVMFSKDDELNKTIRLCTYGTKSNEWNGDICDNDKCSATCRHFSPRVTEEEAINSFNQLLADDKFVLKHMPDVAALQWVLDTRVYSWPCPWWLRFGFWLSRLMWRQPKPVIILPPVDLPKDLWDDPTTDS
jgi:hypothetical protein